MNFKPRISRDGQKGMGCLLVVIGLVAAAFGAAALLGVADNIELNVFGIDLNNRSGRIWWVLGSLAAIGLGVLLLRANKRAA
jgi:hypothetical protein